MLNANVWKSRELQNTHGKLRSAIFDVVTFKGKDMTKATYREKLEALKARFGTRCSTALAVREQHGRDESPFDVPPRIHIARD